MTTPPDFRCPHCDAGVQRRMFVAGTDLQGNALERHVMVVHHLPDCPDWVDIAAQSAAEYVTDFDADGQPVVRRVAGGVDGETP